MNIGVDGSAAVLKNNTLQGNYSKVVVDSIAECFPNHRLMVYTPKVYKRSAATILSLRANIKIKRPGNVLSKAWWKNVSGVVSDMKHHHVHLYHGLAGRLPLCMKGSHIGSVLTIHGLEYLHFPQEFSRWGKFTQSFWTRQSCKRASHIVATSQFGKQELMEHLGIAEDKISVIYHSIDKRFNGEIIDAELGVVRDKYKLPDRYILVVGGLTEHKNLLTVLQAMEQMQDQKINLLILGQDTEYYEKEIREYAKHHHLMHRLNHITRAHTNDMPAIYRMSTVVVNPSRYESFSLPTIEAQACDTPVISARGSGMEETGGESVLYFDPDDSATLATHLDHVLTDETLREQLIAAGRQNLERFTNQRLATELDTLYHQVLAKGSKGSKGNHSSHQHHHHHSH